MPATFEKDRGESVLLSRPFPTSERSEVWRSRTDPLHDIQNQFQLWKGQVERAEELFKERVYENPHPDQYDFMQHRLRLYNLLAQGEHLCVEITNLRRDNDPEAHKTFDEVRVALLPLEKALFEWHTPIDRDATLPESTRKGFAELESGRVMDVWSEK